MFQGMSNYYKVLSNTYSNVSREFKKEMTVEEMMQEARKRIEKILEILYGF